MGEAGGFFAHEAIRPPEEICNARGIIENHSVHHGESHRLHERVEANAFHKNSSLMEKPGIASLKSLVSAALCDEQFTW